MSWQETLWAVPSALGGWWYLLLAAISGPAALVMFAYMILGQPVGARLLARLLLLAALVAFTLSPLNSGWLPWGALLASAGGLMVAALSASDSRKEKSRE